MGSVMGMDVMALPISVVSSCCSRSCSLYSYQSAWNYLLRAKGERKVGQGVNNESENQHCYIDILHSHLAVYSLHGRAGVLHGGKGFLVDVCRFDGVDLLFEH